MGLVKWLQGKKTYLVALVAAAIAALGVLGIAIPDWVMQLLGVLGLVTLRAGISKTIK